MAECHTACWPTPWKAKKRFLQVLLIIGEKILKIVVGPIAHSISDIRYLVETVLQTEPWFYDPKCIELSWREEHVDVVKGRPLALGIIKWDHLVMPHPPVQRGMRIVEEALRSHGHDVIEFEIPDSNEAESLTVGPPYNKLIVVSYI